MMRKCIFRTQNTHLGDKNVFQNELRLSGGGILGSGITFLGQNEFWEQKSRDCVKLTPLNNPAKSNGGLVSTFKMSER